MSAKRCHGCGETKPLDQFTGRPPWKCRACLSAGRQASSTASRPSSRASRYTETGDSTDPTRVRRAQIAAANLKKWRAEDKERERRKRQRNAVIKYAVIQSMIGAGKVRRITFSVLAAPFLLFWWLLWELLKLFGGGQRGARQA